MMQSFISRAVLGVGLTATGMALQSQSFEELAARNCLLVTGRVNETGTSTVDPAYTLRTMPSQVPYGPYVLALVRYDGTVAREVQFQPQHVNGDGTWYFVLALPIDPETQRLVTSIQIKRYGQVLATRSATTTYSTPIFEPRTYRNPVSGMGSQLGILQWDATAWPEALVRDDEGKVIGRLRGGQGSYPLAPGRTSVEVEFSIGTESFRRILTLSTPPVGPR